MTPALPDGVRRAFRLASRRPPIDAEVEDEVAFHLEMRTAELVARGRTPDEARAEALRRFGNIPYWSAAMSAVDREHAAQRRRAEWLEDLWQDLRFAVRSARRAPLFTLLAVLTLALGIGANAAVFGVVKSVLLNALPYADADRLVRIYAHWDATPGERQGVSPGAATDLASRQHAFASVAVFGANRSDVAYLSPAGPKVLSAASVGGRFFRTLGVRAALGRTFTDEDAPRKVVLLSDAAWRREFAADPGVVGRVLRVAGASYEAVGVLPPGFAGPDGAADLWFALDLAPTLRDPGRARGQHWLGLVARLAPGVDRETAQRDVARLGAALAREYPASDAGRTFRVVALRDAMVGATRTPLLVLMASAGLVLLITCANLAGALLSRTVSRRKEFAVRVALGARRSRLVRQLLTESTLLALAGAAVGLALAELALATLRGLTLPALPAYAALSLDVGAVLATVSAALATGVVFGLAPAVAVSRRPPQGTLRGEGRGASEGRQASRLRGALVAAQIALSLSLLVGAGLLGRSLWAIATAPLGLEPDGVLTARVVPPGATYTTPEARARFFEQLQERVAALPGVLGAATTTQLPSPDMSSNSLTIEGVTLAGDGPTFIPYQAVSDAYFRTLGITLVRGRTFGPEDTPGGVPALVINEAMARRYWPRGNPLGARLRVSPHTAEHWGVVVGVVGNVRLDPALGGPEPMAYASNRQDLLFTGRDLVVRAAGDPVALVRPVGRALAALDPSVPLRDPRTLPAVIGERLSGRRLPVLLMSAFGALALVLAGVGVYAMFGNMVAAREREFGVRVALGASRVRIARLVLRQGAAWMGVGIAGGVVGVVLVTRMLRGLLDGVSVADPVVLGGSAVVLLACAALALAGPVRRATRADPIATLR